MFLSEREREKERLWPTCLVWVLIQWWNVELFCKIMLRGVLWLGLMCFEWKWKYACHGKGFWWKVCFVCVLLIAYYGDLKGVSMNRYSLLMHHGSIKLLEPFLSVTVTWHLPCIASIFLQ